MLKLCGKSEWYLEDPEENRISGESPRQRRVNTKRDRRHIESVMFVPLTEGGALRKRLNSMEMEAPFKSRFKYVETTGQSLIGSLGKVDPWAMDCGRTTCFPCRSDPGRCTVQGVVYQIICMRCKELGMETLYYGESARTSFDRGSEHLSALEKMDKESPLVEHHTDDHSGQDPWFEMKVKSVHDKPLHRQCEEAHLIENFSGQKIMNRKGEWGQNLPPRLTIEGEVQGQTKRNRSQNTNGQNDRENPLNEKPNEPEPKAKRRRIGFQTPAQHVSAKPTAKQILDRMWSEVQTPKHTDGQNLS